MLNKISTEEKKFFLYILIGLSLWFLVVVDIVMPTILSNVMFWYTIMLIVYCGFIFKYVLKMGDLTKDTNLFVAYILSTIVGDLILFPYIITKSGILDVPIEVHLVSDIWIYNFIPTYLPEFSKYVIIYIIVPMVLIYIARLLAGRGRFKSVLKAGL